MAWVGGYGRIASGSWWIVFDALPNFELSFRGRIEKKLRKEDGSQMLRVKMK